MGAVLTAQAVTKTYRMGEVEVPALRGIYLELVGGEMVVLLGASGSGKSTLLNIMGGLDVPTAGRILYREQDLTTADERALTAYRRDHVGFVFQFYNLIPSLTARENIALVTDLADEARRPSARCITSTSRRRRCRQSSSVPWPSSSAAPRASTASSARRQRSSRTTQPSRPCPIGSCSSLTGG